VLHFFDPTKEFTPSSLTLSSSYFIANDPISLEEFFSYWKGHYHPKDGQNIALQDARVDIGGNFYKDIYFGIFHKYNVLIKTNKDFTDLYYTAKNKEDFYHDRDYLLNLDIYGIKQSGIVISKNSTLYQDDEHSFKLGGALSLSFGHDMQEGSISGEATSLSEKVYQASAESRYHYTHNYLYDLDVLSASGIGYGADIALAYTNTKYDIGLKLLANDVFSRMYWKKLPYSFVSIQTENKTLDKNGYLIYSPSVSGLEKYTDFTQHIEARYHFSIKKKFYDYVVLSCGLERVYGENFPYIRFDEAVSQSKDIGVYYETRFKSFGFDYRYKNFFLGFSTDALSHFTALGLRGGFQLSF